MKDTIDPARGWDKLVQSQSAPTRELFDSLCAAGDKDKLVLACLPLIQKFNKSTKQHIRQDVECYVIIQVTRAVHQLLQHPNENPGSYLIDVIKHAIEAARFGTTDEARDCVSSDSRLYRPRKRKSDGERDNLIAQLQQEGHSQNMIDSELELRGFDRRRIVDVKEDWPISPVDGSLQDFGKCESKADDWSHLVELFEAGVIDDSEIQLLDCLLQGHTHDEAANIFSTHVSTIGARFARIKSKICDHEARDGV